ncbi:uncharacterized protein LOC113233313 [Hyposmocoma kahamanoa]|uniref:uncharacterized protein LOC113233313 n=1 Tax=Hyposmocoma kahamanoa TaxID=1477025 RepID=UPI000E6D8474|nr:uncharacterized protein LOC113233313 [Hyposmocoma kahamanoa]
MKSITIILAVVLAGVYASRLPDRVQLVPTEYPIEGQNVVTDSIAEALENVSNRIRDAGLDPWTFDRAGFAFELPVPVILSIDALIENIAFRGLSNIVINSINFAILSGRLTLDISLPELSVEIGNVALDAVALGADINVHINGRLSVIEPRVSGEVVLNFLGVIVGPIIRSIDLEFDLQRIQYNGRFNFFGTDISERVNTFVSVNIPNAIVAHQQEVNELVEIIARQIIEDFF